MTRGAERRQVACVAENEHTAVMPSGYEKSPDYGGPEPTIGGIVAAIVVMIAVSALVAWGVLAAG